MNFITVKHLLNGCDRNGSFPQCCKGTGNCYKQLHTSFIAIFVFYLQFDYIS